MRHRPLVDQIQHNNVKKYLESGKASGADLALGGDEQPSEQGFFVKPHIFTRVDDTAQINAEEIFGPVSIVHSFSDEKEVIRRANNTEYGLFGEYSGLLAEAKGATAFIAEREGTPAPIASVFTQDVDRALRFAKFLDAGVRIHIHLCRLCSQDAANESDPSHSLRMSPSTAPPQCMRLSSEQLMLMFATTSVTS